MPRTMSKSDFNTYLKQKGIVLLKEEQHFDPSNFTEPIITFIDEKAVVSEEHIDFGLYAPMSGTTVLDCLQKGMKINLIKIVRYYTGLGLKDAKYLCDTCMEKWSIQYLNTIPIKELPKMINNSEYCTGFRDAIKKKLSE